jgi:hypothetical protein
LGTTLNATLQRVFSVLFNGTEWCKCDGNNKNNPGSNLIENSLWENFKSLTFLTIFGDKYGTFTPDSNL